MKIKKCDHSCLHDDYEKAKEKRWVLLLLYTTDIAFNCIC